MVPDLKRAFPFHLANNAIRRADTVMGGLKNCWNLFRDGYGKYEKIAEP
jgi:hypothetical protein